MTGYAVLAALYGTLAGGVFAPAPNNVVVGDAWVGSSSITERQANELGYKMLVDEPPACQSNQYAVATGYGLDSATGGMRIRRTYEIRTAVPAPRRWTPLSIKRAADKLGHWQALKAFLVAADAYEDFAMAQYEAEDDVDFVRLMSAARLQLGDAAVDAVLNAAEVEP